MSDLATVAMDAHGGLDRWRRLNAVEERGNPRESFRGHKFDTPWDKLQLAYFAGYAMWTYLNTPFLFALPGVETEELEQWQEGMVLTMNA